MILIQAYKIIKDYNKVHQDSRIVANQISELGMCDELYDTGSHVVLYSMTVWPTL